ncbi:hypothetical protein H4582DRAFT_1588247 [Lactarius indigo]|nr:hypothetical protein H4582DRAFT_1588247 [Lactarius indigo]
MPPSFPVASPVVETNTLPPLPKIQSAQTREQIFTHSSLTAKRRGEFEAPRDTPSRDNEELAHIGDQVVSLAITDLIHGRYPRLRVGPTSQLRSRIKRGSALAEIAVRACKWMCLRRAIQGARHGCRQAMARSALCAPLRRCVLGRAPEPSRSRAGFTSNYLSHA